MLVNPDADLRLDVRILEICHYARQGFLSNFVSGTRRTYQTTRGIVRAEKAEGKHGGPATFIGGCTVLRHISAISYIIKNPMLSYRHLQISKRRAS